MTKICLLCPRLGSDVTPAVVICVGSLHQAINYTNSSMRPNMGQAWGFCQK